MTMLKSRMFVTYAGVCSADVYASNVDAFADIQAVAHACVTRAHVLAAHAGVLSVGSRG